VAVDDAAVDLEQLGGDDSEARGGGDAEARLHVGDDAGAGTPDRLALGLGGGGCGGGLRDARGRGRGGRRLGRCRRGGGRGLGGGTRLGCGVALVVGEEVTPALAHRLRVRQVLL